ncbi:MAG: ribosome small subunit-dependent GTPase A [Rothia sp. (in: high G+C Gram-positive bacteria)]|nr:ribosome small subunit-dependent GTPase A [Rothia sp. (in: high G+C Gram-positive bacteria)]
MPRVWDEAAVRVRPSKKGSRPRTKERPSHDKAQIGRVITVDRGRYRVILDEGSPRERTVTAVRAKELRRQGIVVGDRVGLVGDTSAHPGSLARLVRIEQRKTLLRRSADDTDPYERMVVANASQLMIVVAAANPQPRTGFIDRSLVAAFEAGLHPVLCISKTDLASPQPLLDYYARAELSILFSRPASRPEPTAGDLTALDPQLIERLQQVLAGEVTVLLGHSGVGKSTLVNALTGAQRDTGVVNAVTGRGRHTSSSAFALQPSACPAGTWIIDTPGIRSLGLAHVKPANIVAAFTELAPASADCPRGCRHDQTAQGCAISAYVAQGYAGQCGPARLESLRRLLGVHQPPGAQAETETGVIE